MLSVISWNSRGLGGASKKCHLKNLITCNKVDVISILETKCASISFPLIRKVWCMGDFDWLSIDAVGTSGGMLVIWNRCSFVITVQRTFGRWIIISRILWCFYAMSSLRVNFYKSTIYGVNIEDELLISAASLACCKIGNLPFHYLGLLLGANPKRASTWLPVVRKIEEIGILERGNSLSCRLSYSHQIVPL
ncbi:hypothetical protein P3X46_004514 [Hevea brasiliensis]|uniref:Reverse transcriptase zinc-binding domain-containing protein n=1 Tax=Hevea brasiliensis TaxID=3981 RepID=A0ABQ9MXM0_HEVBR|nr:hypothetical protein P3X46_004514 [Hevea brasiliensis]